MIRRCVAVWKVRARNDGVSFSRFFGLRNQLEALTAKLCFLVAASTHLLKLGSKLSDTMLTDIAHLICDAMQDQQYYQSTLSSLARTSSAWYSIAIPVLYSCIRLDDNDEQGDYSFGMRHFGMPQPGPTAQVLRYWARNRTRRLLHTLLETPAGKRLCLLVKRCEWNINVSTTVSLLSLLAVSELGPKKLLTFRREYALSSEAAKTLLWQPSPYSLQLRFYLQPARSRFLTILPP